MFLIVEEISGPWVVIEWGRDTFKIPKYLVPGSVQKGDQIQIEVQLLSDGQRLRRSSNTCILSEED